jgi:hypothetical protein
LKKLLFTTILILSISSLLFSERTLFVGTIPLNGRIPLQETFSLDVTFQVPFLLNQNIAGGEYKIATYEFFSNSPDLLYQMKLSPGIDTALGKGIFAFRNITDGGVDTGANPIPFRLIVKDSTETNEVSNAEFMSVVKDIGILTGSRYEESGTIFVAFPTLSEGFEITDFLSGFYEAAIFVEVLVD